MRALLKLLERDNRYVCQFKDEDFTSEILLCPHMQHKWRLNLRCQLITIYIDRYVGLPI